MRGRLWHPGGDLTGKPAPAQTLLCALQKTLGSGLSLSFSLMQEKRQKSGDLSKVTQLLGGRAGTRRQVVVPGSRRGP